MWGLWFRARDMVRVNSLGDVGDVDGKLMFDE
jgi:hypothetical protein